MKLKLVEKRDEAVGTKSFFWQPESEIKWTAGQYYHFTIPSLKYPDDRGATRHFTISSSPTEGQMLRLTTKIREESGYKKTLDEIPVGTEVDGDEMEGTFTLDEKDKSPQVFIAGGIGITPFRSIIKYVIDKNLDIPVYLIYSNSVPEEITFKKELEDWSKNYSNIKIVMTVSRPEKSPWNGPTGRIDENLIRSQFDIWHLMPDVPTFWISGPPPMVSAIEEILEKMGISSEKIRSEKFTGY